MPDPAGSVKKAALAAVFLALGGAALSCIGPAAGRPLWAGARFTTADRNRAVQRGLHFIYSIARNPKYFNEWGFDLLWCLHCISATSKDPGLSQTAWNMGHERALEWRRLNPSLPPNASADVVAWFASASDVADRLGARDEGIKEQVRRAAARFTARDFLSFDPTREPPPADVPKQCPRCGRYNPRGATTCRKCGTPLKMQSRYDVWYDALITTYTGDTYGVTLGAHYPDVIRWISVMRPYRGPENNPEFYETVYAVTHVVYTLNDYSRYRVSPQSLPDEFAYLKETMHAFMAERDSETVGEYLDTLRSFGMTEADPLIQSGMSFLLSTQNPDGSWGDMNDPDIYSRYHPTWTAVDGLREYRWTEKRR